MGEDIKKEEKILRTIEEHEEGINPKMISFYSGINHNTVKSIVKKLEREGKIKLKNGIRGVYVLVENSQHGSIFNFNFHNLILTCTVQNFEGEFQPKKYYFGNELIKTILSINENTKKATMNVSTSNPINISALLVIIHYFLCQLRIHTGRDISEKEVVISSIEFNKDYINLRLDGANCLTVDSLIAQYKLYQKEHCVREEFKLKEPISFPVLSQLLASTNFQADLRNEIEKQKKEINNLKENIKQIIGQLNRLSKAIIELNLYIKGNFLQFESANKSK